MEGGKKECGDVGVRGGGEKDGRRERESKIRDVAHVCVVMIVFICRWVCTCIGNDLQKERKREQGS